MRLYDNIAENSDLVLDLPLYSPLLGEAGKVLDRSKSHANGTLTGTTLGSQGRTLDGVGDFISVAHNATLNYTTNATMWFWVRLLANGPATGGYIYSKGFYTGAADNGEYYAYVGNGNSNMTFGWRGNTTEEFTGGTYTLNEWTFGASTFNGGVAVDTYRNTALVTHDTSIFATLINTTNPLNIGRLQRSPANSYQNMILGEIGGINRTLTIQEILQIYFATIGTYV